MELSKRATRARNNVVVAGVRDLEDSCVKMEGTLARKRGSDEGGDCRRCVSMDLEWKSYMGFNYTLINTLIGGYDYPYPDSN